MKIVFGKEGLDHTFQQPFPEAVPCVQEGCDGECHIGFVAHECHEPITSEGGEYLFQLHENTPREEGFWLHDACAVAVYFCRKCLNLAARYNQA